MFANVLHSSTPTPPVSRPLTPIEAGKVLTKIPLALTKEERENESTEALKKCPFTKHGCHYQGSRLAVQEHIRDQNDAHILLIGEQLKPLRNEVHEAMGPLESGLAASEDFQIKATPLLHLYSHNFVWRIDSYPTKYRAAESGDKLFIHSPSFLSHRFGYNLRASLAPFGTDAATREYASIFITILPGISDAILRWPFSALLTFTLFDQTGSNPLVAKLTPQPVDENLPYLGRPKGVANQAFGLQAFVKISEMHEGGRFVKNGAVFIAIDLSLE